MKQIIVNNISTNYYITEDGKCFNQKTGKYLKGQSNCKNKYHSYNLTLPDGTKKRMYAHRLVATAYIPNDDPINKNQVNHKDGNVLNNNVDNLEWVTQSENQQHAIQTELRSYKHIFCFTPDKKLVAEYKTLVEASNASKVSMSCIEQQLRKNKPGLSGGFYWSHSPVLGDVETYKNTGKAKRVYQYNLDGKFLAEYPSCGQAARATHSNHRHISACCRGGLKTHNGFIWRYADDIVSPSMKIEVV